MRDPVLFRSVVCAQRSYRKIPRGTNKPMRTHIKVLINFDINFLSNNLWPLILVLFQLGGYVYFVMFAARCYRECYIREAICRQKTSCSIDTKAIRENKSQC